MTLADLFETVEDRRKRVTLYGTDEDAELLDRFHTRNVDVQFRRLPSGGLPGFFVVRDRDGFVGSIDVGELRALLEPPIHRPWDPAFAGAEYRVLYELLDETVFTSLDRRQLLAAAREIEDRAWRVGTGTLRVGFQALSAMQAQVPVYERFGREADLDVHVYGDADWDPPPIPGVRVHEEPGEEIGSFWLLAFDGGGDESYACGLLAEEHSPDEFVGFWTYDPDLVHRMLDHLERTYG